MSNPNTNPLSEIWSGVYSSFSEVPVNPAAFSGDQWIQRTCESTAELLKKCKSPDTIKARPWLNESPAAVCAALMYPTAKELRILDFGGGAGKLWAHLQANLSDVETISLTIVENEQMVASAGVLFEEIPQVSFVSKLPEDACYDMVHAQSSLQYVENWKGCIGKFSAYQPEYIILSDFYAGDLEAYVTAQNYYGLKIPHHIFNLAEAIAEFSLLGYQLLFKSAFQGVFFGIVQPLPMENLEPCRRLPHACNLIFKKSSVDAPV